MPAIPSGFKPTIQGYSFSGPGGIVRTEVAGGMSRYSSEWEGAPQDFQVAMQMPAEQFAVWAVWFHHIVAKGALPFTMQLDSGLGPEMHTVRMLPGSYSAQRAGGQVTTVGFSVSAPSTVYGMTLEAAQALIDAYNGYPAAPGLPVIPRDMKPVIQGYGFEGPDGVMASQIAGGAPRNALVTNRDAQTFRVTLILKPDAFAAWTAFFLRVLRAGAVAFQMPLDGGMGLQDHYCQILPGSYSVSRAGGQVSAVTFAVEAVSRVYDIAAGDAQAWIDLWTTYGDEYDALLERLAVFANEDLLVLQ